MPNQHTRDIAEWSNYQQEGGTLGLSAWLAAGKPSAKTYPSTPFTSNKTIPPSGNPSAPMLPHPSPNAIGDTIDADIAAAEKAAAEKDAADAATKKASAEDFTNPTQLPKTPLPEGFKWDWDGFRWQPKAVEEGAKVDPELSNPRQMPSSSPPPNHHWEWKGSQWQPVKDEVPKEGTKYPKPADWKDYTDSDGNIHRWDENAGGEYISGYDPTADQKNPANKKGADLNPDLTNPTKMPVTPAPTGFHWEWDGTLWQPIKDEKGKETPRTPLPAGQQRTYTDSSGKVWTWDETTGDYNQTGYDPKSDQGTISTQQKTKQSSDQFWAQFDAQQRQEQARLQAEKDARLANLRANPASWLEYNQLAGQTPVIQPWQKPLMPQQYGNLNVGQPIPGWQGLNQGSSNLPELTTPSTQYFARIGPTAQQQWGGYQQMQSGAPIDESMFRLQSQSAPGGRNQGLSWLR